MKVFVALLSLVSSGALAMNIGSRIPPDAIAMTVGVVVGALATIPVSLVIGIVLARRGLEPERMVVPDDYSAPAPYASHPPYPRIDGYNALRDMPPVVIVNPASFEGQRRAYPAARFEAPVLSGPREFRLVGEEAS